MQDKIRSYALKQSYPTARYLCPSCSSQRRHNKHDRCLSITVDGNKALYQCWHCGESGALSLTQTTRVLHAVRPRPVIALSSPTEDEQEAAFEYLASRGITRKTAVDCHVFGGNKFIDGHMQMAVAFPYGGAKPYAAKWRAIGSKAFTQDGAAQSLWLSEKIDKAKPVAITEGEVDCLSLWQVGLQAVSVPNGAPNKTPRPEAKGKFGLIDGEGSSILNEASKVIVAVDSDEPGNILAEEIARRVGRAKCWRALWPDDCKDANDVLRIHGPDVLRECIANAQPWPIKGLYEASHYFDAAIELYDKGMPKGVSTGFQNVDEYYTVVPGQLTVVTGSPGSGKSTFVDNILGKLALKQGWRIGVCSFENPPHVHIAKLAGIVSGTPYFQGPTPRMDQEKRDKVLAWLKEHFFFLHQQDGSLSSLDDIVELAKTAVLRYGIKGLVIDPYNFIDRGDANETDWVSDALTKLKVLAMAHDLHIWFVAHPTKLRRKDDGSFPVPTGYDIAGCYTDDTEVLTQRGWLKHSELSLADRIACFDTATSTMEYHQPSRIIRKEYSGNIHHLKGYGYDLQVTPEHRLVVMPYWQANKETGRGRPVRWPKGQWSFVEAKDLPKAQFSIPLSGRLTTDGQDTISENMARIAGWYVSEGSKVSSGASICQAIGPRCNLIEDLLVSEGIPYTFSVCGPGGKGGTKDIGIFYIGAKQAKATVDFLHNQCGVGSQNKMIPDAIMTGSAHNKKAFLDAYLLGDGCPSRNGWRAVTTSVKLRDQLQRLCLELGLSCSWYERAPVNANHNVSWQINICQGSRDKTSLHASRNVTLEPYTGTVWCLTVPTGAYFVRRNGKALACGNSAHFFNKADMGITIHRPNPEDRTTEFHCWKVRFSFTGKIGKTSLNYDVATGTYIEPYYGSGQ